MVVYYLFTSRVPFKFATFGVLFDGLLAVRYRRGYVICGEAGQFRRVARRELAFGPGAVVSSCVRIGPGRAGGAFRRVRRCYVACIGHGVRSVALHPQFSPAPLRVLVVDRGGRAQYYAFRSRRCVAVVCVHWDICHYLGVARDAWDLFVFFTNLFRYEPLIPWFIFCGGLDGDGIVLFVNVLALSRRVVYFNYV